MLPVSIKSPSLQSKRPMSRLRACRLIIGRKDKTLQEILATLESLYLKLDRLGALSLVEKSLARDLTLSLSAPRSENGSLIPVTSYPTYASSSSSRFEVPYRSSAEVYRILSLPATEKILSNNLSDVNQLHDVFPTSEIWLENISKDFAKPVIAAERIKIAIADTPYFLFPNPVGPSGSYLLSSGTIDELVTAYFSRNSLQSH